MQNDNILIERIDSGPLPNQIRLRIYDKKRYIYLVSFTIQDLIDKELLDIDKIEKLTNQIYKLK